MICAILLATPGAALAHKIKVDSKVTINKKQSGPNGAKGKVKADKAVCERKRTVKLFRESGSYAARGAAPDQFIGRDRTNRKGIWIVDEPLLAGDYYVILPRNVFDRRHKIICLPDRSRTVKL